jgi:hypothetical protein
MLPPKGLPVPFGYAHVPNTDRTASTTDFDLGLGHLLNLSVFAQSGAPSLGQTFLVVDVIRGRGASAYTLGTLVQGYVTGSQRRAWPGSPIQSTLEGAPFARLITGTTPAAGAEISETVPTGARWLVRSLASELVTSATAGTRQPTANFYTGPGSERWARSVNPGTLGASGNRSFYWAQGMTLAVAIEASIGVGGLATGLWLTAGMRLGTETFALAAGDQWDAPRYEVDELLEAA